MEAGERCTASQMALELAELSRLDIACNRKDWKHAVIDAVRTRPDAPVRMPEDWMYEVHIALNCVLIARIRESHGRTAMLLVRHAFEQTLLEQVAASGASFETLARVEFLQAFRFGALFAEVDRPEPDPRPLSARLAESLFGRPPLADDSAGRLAAGFEQFSAAMAKRVAAYALVDVSPASSR